MGRHRRRAPRGSDEVTDPGGLLDQEEDVLGNAAIGLESHLDEDIAGIELGLGDALLAALERLGLLGGDHDSAHEFFHALDLHLAEQGLSDRASLLLATRSTNQSMPGRYIGRSDAGIELTGFVGGEVGLFSLDRHADRCDTE